MALNRQKMESCTRDSGIKTKGMGLELSFGLMVLVMREPGKRVKQTELVE